MKTKEPLIPFIVADKPIIGLERGTHNGYVAIPPSHPLYGKYCFDVEDKIRVHGGLTLSEPVILQGYSFGSCHKVNPELVGKRHPLLDNAEYIGKQKEVPDYYWIFGFDTAHWGDNPIDCDRDYVVKETMDLLEQLEDLYV